MLKPPKPYSTITGISLRKLHAGHIIDSHQAVVIYRLRSNKKLTQTKARTAK